MCKNPVFLCGSNISLHPDCKVRTYPYAKPYYTQHGEFCVAWETQEAPTSLHTRARHLLRVEYD
jgi:hypothetical protein